MTPLSQTAFFVRVNGEPLSVPGACTLADLVAQRPHTPPPAEAEFDCTSMGRSVAFTPA